jgi:hypothetical protein
MPTIKNKAHFINKLSYSNLNAQFIEQAKEKAPCPQPVTQQILS